MRYLVDYEEHLRLKAIESAAREVMEMARGDHMFMDSAKQASIWNSLKNALAITTFEEIAA